MFNRKQTGCAFKLGVNYDWGKVLAYKVNFLELAILIPVWFPKWKKEFEWDCREDVLTKKVRTLYLYLAIVKNTRLFPMIDFEINTYRRKCDNQVRTNA